MCTKSVASENSNHVLYGHTPCGSNLLVPLALSLSLSKILEKSEECYLIHNESHCIVL